MDNKLRQIRDNIYDAVREEILGPGSEQTGLPVEEEIITDKPSKRYSTGVLFTKEEAQSVSINENPDDNNEDKDELKEKENNSLEENESIKQKEYKYTIDEEFYEDINNSHILKKSSMGMTFFCNKDINILLVRVNGARYKEVKTSECMVRYSGDLLPLQDLEVAMVVYYEDGFLKLKDRFDKSFIDKFEEKGYFINRETLKDALYKLLKQCNKYYKAYKRFPIKFNNPIQI